MRGPSPHRHLRHLPLEPQAWKEGLRACSEGLLPDIVKGPELGESDTVTVRRGSAPSRTGYTFC